MPDAPHIPKIAVVFLAERFATTRCHLECGAGGSTVLVRGDTVLERRVGWSGWTDFVYPRLIRELATA